MAGDRASCSNVTTCWSGSDRSAAATTSAHSAATAGSPAPWISAARATSADAFLLGDALVARPTTGDDSGLDGYAETCLRRVWDYQEISQWLSEVYHGSAAGDPFRAGTTLARLRRLFTSPAAAAAFAEQYLGTAARY